MSPTKESRRLVAEIQVPSGGAGLRMVAGRPLFQYWSVLHAYSRLVFLAPHGRVSDHRVSWTWTEVPDTKALAAPDLIKFRRRLRETKAALSDAAAFEGRKEGDRATREALRSAAGAVDALVAKSDAALRPFLAQTSSGVMVHSWCAHRAAVPFCPDTIELEVAGTVVVRGVPASGHQVLLEDGRGEVVSRTRSDASGGFLFADLAPGRYRVRGVSDQVDFPVTGIGIEIEGSSVSGVELKSSATADRKIAEPSPLASLSKPLLSPTLECNTAKPEVALTVREHPVHPEPSSAHPSTRSRGLWLCVAFVGTSSIALFFVGVKRNPVSSVSPLYNAAGVPPTDRSVTPLAGEIHFAARRTGMEKTRERIAPQTLERFAAVQRTPKPDLTNSAALPAEASFSSRTGITGSPQETGFPNAPALPAANAGIVGQGAAPTHSSGNLGASNAPAAGASGAPPGTDLAGTINTPSTLPSALAVSATRSTSSEGAISPSAPSLPLPTPVNPNGTSPRLPEAQSASAGPRSTPTPSRIEPQEASSALPTTQTQSRPDANESADAMPDDTDKDGLPETAPGTHRARVRSTDSKAEIAAQSTESDRESAETATPIPETSSGRENPSNGTEGGSESSRPEERSVTKRVALTHVFQVKLSPWRLALARDALVVTHPILDDAPDQSEARRLAQLEERQRRTPPELESAGLTFGVTVFLGSAQPVETALLYWRDVWSGRRLEAGATRQRSAELSWVVGTLRRGRFVLEDAAGHTLADVSVDERGGVDVSVAPGGRAWVWLNVEPRLEGLSSIEKEAWASRLGWRRLDGRTLPIEWTQDQAGALTNGSRLDLISNAAPGANVFHALALVDEATDWGWVVQLQQTF